MDKMIKAEISNKFILELIGLNLIYEYKPNKFKRLDESNKEVLILELIGNILGCLLIAVLFGLIGIPLGMGFVNYGLILMCMVSIPYLFL